VFAFLAMWIGCAASGPSAGLDSGLAGDVDTGDACRDAPLVTWDSWGHGFMLSACQGCHGADVDDRHGAPQGVGFDTVDQVWQWSALILQRAAPATGSPTMPPAGGTTEDDRTRLRWWLACGTPGS